MSRFRKMAGIGLALLMLICSVPLAMPAAVFSPILLVMIPLFFFIGVVRLVFRKSFQMQDGVAGFFAGYGFAGAALGLIGAGSAILGHALHLQPQDVFIVSVLALAVVHLAFITVNLLGSSQARKRPAITGLDTGGGVAGVMVEIAILHLMFTIMATAPALFFLRIMLHGGGEIVPGVPVPLGPIVSRLMVAFTFPGAILVLGILQRGFYLFEMARQIRILPTPTLRSAAAGLVDVTGVVVESGHAPSGEGAAGTGAAFVLDDGTGRAVVECPEGWDTTSGIGPSLTDGERSAHPFPAPGDRIRVVGDFVPETGTPALYGRVRAWKGPGAGSLLAEITRGLLDDTFRVHDRRSSIGQVLQIGRPIGLFWMGHQDEHPVIRRLQVAGWRHVAVAGLIALGDALLVTQLVRTW